MDKTETTFRYICCRQNSSSLMPPKPSYMWLTTRITCPTRVTSPHTIPKGHISGEWAWGLKWGKMGRNSKEEKRVPNRIQYLQVPLSLSCIPENLRITHISILRTIAENLRITHISILRTIAYFVVLLRITHVSILRTFTITNRSTLLQHQRGLGLLHFAE